MVQQRDRAARLDALLSLTTLSGRSRRKVVRSFQQHHRQLPTEKSPSIDVVKQGWVLYKPVTVDRIRGLSRESRSGKDFGKTFDTFKQRVSIKHHLCKLHPRDGCTRNQSYPKPVMGDQVRDGTCLTHSFAGQSRCDYQTQARLLTGFTPRDPSSSWSSSDLLRGKEMPACSMASLRSSPFSSCLQRYNNS